MKKNFSTSWMASKQPRKQRKFRARAPLHARHRFLNANLDKTLRKKHFRRSLPVRKGDTVLIMRGNFKGKTGKIEEVKLRNAKVSLEKIFRSKKDGTKVKVFFQPSNLQIKELNLEDKERIKILNKKEKQTKEKK